MIAAKIPGMNPGMSIGTMRPLKAARALPEGSLGREYLAFVEAEGISADGLVEASDIARQRSEAAELRWIRNWLRDSHDLWHAVLFYTTGDAVRRELDEAGAGEYEPMMFAQGIFKSFHETVKSNWTAYLDGDRTLEEAAEDLVRAAGEVEAGGP